VEDLAPIFACELDLLEERLMTPVVKEEEEEEEEEAERWKIVRGRRTVGLQDELHKREPSRRKMNSGL
jgi:hypothetical protein